MIGICWLGLHQTGDFNQDVPRIELKVQNAKISTYVLKISKAVMRFNVRRGYSDCCNWKSKMRWDLHMRWVWIETLLLWQTSSVGQIIGIDCTELLGIEADNALDKLHNISLSYFCVFVPIL